MARRRAGCPASFLCAWPFSGREPQPAWGGFGARRGRLWGPRAARVSPFPSPAAAAELSLLRAPGNPQSGGRGERGGNPLSV